MSHELSQLSIGERLFAAKERLFWTKAEFGLGWRLAFVLLFFFFFGHAFVWLRLLFNEQFSHKVWLFYFFNQSVHIVHYLWTHKFHFSVTFLLKIGFTVLFTHLKIILLQYFSVFNCIQTDSKQMCGLHHFELKMSF